MVVTGKVELTRDIKFLFIHKSSNLATAKCQIDHGERSLGLFEITWISLTQSKKERSNQIYLGFVGMIDKKYFLC